MRGGAPPPRHLDGSAPNLKNVAPPLEIHALSLPQYMHSKFYSECYEQFFYILLVQQCLHLPMYTLGL